MIRTPLHDVEGLLFGDDVIDVVGQEGVLVHQLALDATNDRGFSLTKPRYILRRIEPGEKTMCMVTRSLSRSTHLQHFLL